MPIRDISILAAAVLAAASTAHAAPAPIAGEAQFRAIFKEMIETDTSAATGDCTVLANRIAARMKAAGFPAANLQIIVPPTDAKAGNLVATYPGTDPSLRAILMLGHIDVVNAFRADWTRDPFTLIEEGGEFYGRGVSDMKSQDAIWVDTMLRLQQAGARPRRTVKMALTCGEEGGGFVNGAGYLADNHKALIDAAIGLTEGGGGDLDDQGKKLAVTVMAAEKVGANYTFETSSIGGHSSKPRGDNAIYRMAFALENLSAVKFPVQFNTFNRPYFVGIMPQVSPAEGAAIRALLANPADTAAAAIVKKNVSWAAMLGATCIPTLIEGGHAPNAQPQRVKTTINCRLLPGVPVAELTQTIVAAVADPQVKISVVAQGAPGARAAIPPVTPALLEPIKRVAAEVYPGVPVVTMQETFGTDSGRLIAAGIPTWGVSGLFRGADAGNIHGLNEHIGVRSVMEGREFLYKLIKAYAEAP